MKYSIVLPIYDPKNQKTWLSDTMDAIDENSNHHEVITVKNVEGYVNAVNIGLKEAQGDYITVLNDDVIIQDPDWLPKLANDNAITSWRKNPFYMNGEMMPDGSCWCISRDLFEKMGLMDERYGKGYGCDEIDYFYTAQEAGGQLLEAPVNLTHLENQTYSTYFSANKEAMTSRNASLFYEKWKDKLDIRA